MSGDFYTIQTVELGRRMADSSFFLYLTEPGVPLEIAYRLWILRRAGRTLLVDTGPPADEGGRRGLTYCVDVVQALATLGIDAAEVDTIFLTHLHWDHAANAERFPKATFFAQKSEIEFFLGRRREYPSVDRFFSHHAYLRQLIDQGRIKAIEGDAQIDDGLSAMRVGGHTPGSQMLLVSTAGGMAIITGDAIPLHRNYLERIPSGILVDVFEAAAAIDRVSALRPVAIYTGHDISPCLPLAPGSKPAGGWEHEKTP